MWLSWLGIILQSKRSQARLPVRAHTWAAGLVPGLGANERQQISVSLSVSVSLPLSLSLPLSVKRINK